MNIRDFFVLSMLSSSLFAAADVVVEIESGQIAGAVLENNVREFLGVPYAAPPVGDLRWKPPAAATAWSGLREAKTHAPACMQMQYENIKKSEDCLYINVWTKAAAEENLPVMVWIHGGGWYFGSSRTSIYDGSAFAENGVVLVSLNYRLGSFGWLAHPILSQESPNKVSGNYGILDAIAALEWVQRNIHVFGGDANNVTVFGESAGAASVFALLATQKAEGLFDKVIMQSTWINEGNVANLKSSNGFSESAELTGIKAIQSRLGEVDSKNLLTEMRNLSVEDVLALRVRPKLVFDGWLFEEDPLKLFHSGKQMSVPMLTGYNDGEGQYLTRPERVPQTLEEQKKRRILQVGDANADLLDMYTAKNSEDLYEKEIDFLGERDFIWASRETALASARAGQSDTFMYIFKRNRYQNEARASHAMELSYVFNNLPLDASKEDKELSSLMNNYWVQFAKTGSPGGNGLPKWPHFDIATQRHKVLDLTESEGKLDRMERLDILDAYIRDRYNPNQ